MYLEHAYALRDELDPVWAARPLALVPYDARLALVLEYPGGELLGRLMGEPWEVTPFLRAAIGFAIRTRAAPKSITIDSGATSGLRAMVLSFTLARFSAVMDKRRRREKH